MSGRPASSRSMMTPEVEQIILSGRNSPLGPLSPRSRSNSGTNTPLGFTSPLSPVDMAVLENDHLEEHMDSLTNGYSAVEDHPVEQSVLSPEETEHQMS